MQQIIEQAEQDIHQALLDYGRYTCKKEVLDDVSEEFIKNLAEDSSYAKQELRNLFRKSPVWDEGLSALVINGTRTHDPDYNRILSLACEILQPAYGKGCSEATNSLIRKAIDYFSLPDDGSGKKAEIDAINALAPKAYEPAKKPSRIFKALCTALGVADETAGSDFQKLYAQFADELSAKKISFKLYVSINPAHFLTMSNPKGDGRGSTLTSCHSFNATDYPYNNGCIGYARDKVSFIVFTVDDPDKPELLNNRKTTRQVFAYKPGNGLLMQSRLYNTSGGTRWEQQDSALYRDLVQREISMLEDAPNLWKTYPYCGGHEDCVKTHPAFGGYTDWTHSEFAGKVSIRADHEEDWEPLTVGAPGLCICCGEEFSEGLYCQECSDSTCEECGLRFRNTVPVHGEDGHMIFVCEECCERYYTCCSVCGEYYLTDRMTLTGDGEHVCTGCRERHYISCNECGEYYHRSEMYSAMDRNGCSVDICSDCRDGYYTRCEECGNHFHDSLINRAYNWKGFPVYVCDGCLEEYPECPGCGNHAEMTGGCRCPVCGAAAGEETGRVLA